MVCCYWRPWYVFFALLNGFVPDQLVCDIDVCKLGAGGCERFILKRVLYDWFLIVWHWDYMVHYMVVSTYRFTCSLAHLFAVKCHYFFIFNFINMTGRLKVQQYLWPYQGKVYWTVLDTGLCVSFASQEASCWFHFKWLICLL